MRTAVLIALGAVGVGGVHLLVRFLGRKLENEMVKYPHGPTTSLGWLPVSSLLPSAGVSSSPSTPRFLP